MRFFAVEFPLRYGPEQPDFPALLTHFSTSSGVSELAIERTNERSGAREPREQGGASE